jgi:hypothetical protein
VQRRPPKASHRSGGDGVEIVRRVDCARTARLFQRSARGRGGAQSGGLGGVRCCERCGTTGQAALAGGGRGGARGGGRGGGGSGYSRSQLEQHRAGGAAAGAEG